MTSQKQIEASRANGESAPEPLVRYRAAPENIEKHKIQRTNLATN
jgi:hypothetical protein